MNQSNFFILHLTKKSLNYGNFYNNFNFEHTSTWVITLSIDFQNLASIGGTVLIINSFLQEPTVIKS